jgi:hypothetical protein
VVSRASTPAELGAAAAAGLGLAAGSFGLVQVSCTC